ncbi:methyltransferase domain-containing protein [Paraurantiacibacter namhicola]|uniref:Uncharacterized protein n=1 Tax=Paraurantiacibacter namhicola TaxID=645517 RepID=A0A1C7D958_9SPHN|nr:methyltransferase domain-containing protein [Paraurantiacibacter namhicola]ANU08020.1 hypothetical protein A6F65_01723 [Paraurantiacibacter namhicola]
MDQTPPKIFDRQRAAAKWARSRSRLASEDAAHYLLEAMARDVLERLDFMQFEPETALVVGDHDGTLREGLAVQQSMLGELGEFDEEQPGAQDAFDLIVHLLGLGHVNDLPGALLHAHRALKPGGLFMAAFPGAGSLPVLRDLAMIADGERPAPRMHPLVDNRAATGLLERGGFARQVVDTFPVRVRYSSLSRLVEDLRDQGLTRALTAPAPPLRRSGWAKAEAEFDKRRDDDGKVTETFEILVLTGWKA